MRYEIETIKVKVAMSESIGQVNSSVAACDVLDGIFKTLDSDQEHFVMLCMDVKNNIYGYKVLFSGAQDSVSIDPKVLFRNALLMGAVSIIIAHNHPSGDPAPSEGDNHITKMIAQGCKLLQMNLLDHIVIGSGKRFYSYLGSGLLNRLQVGL